MDLRDTKKGNISVLTIVGRLDSTNSTEFDEYLAELFDRNEHNILVNCGSLVYVSSSGLRSFLMGLKKTQAARGKFYLCNLTPQVREVFDMSGFSMLFKVYSSENEAVENM